MPTRAEMLKKLSPDERAECEALLKLEESTFWTRESFKASIELQDQFIEEYTHLYKTHLASENVDVIRHCSKIAEKLATMLFNELGDTPSSGEVATSVFYFLNLMAFSSLEEGQLAALIRMVKSSLQLMTAELSTHAIKSAFGEILNPQRQRSN